MANIIIPRKSGQLGRSRSEQEENLRKEWGPTMTDEQLDKIKFIEKRAKEVLGTTVSHIHPIDADKVK